VLIRVFAEVFDVNHVRHPSVIPPQDSPAQNLRESMYLLTTQTVLTERFARGEQARDISFGLSQTFCERLPRVIRLSVCREKSRTVNRLADCRIVTHHVGKLSFARGMCEARRRWLQGERSLANHEN